MEHTEAERQVYMTTRAYLLSNGDRDDAVAQLTEDGLSNVAAKLRTDLVVMAFGWGLLKKMGVCQFPSEFELSDTGEKVKVSNSHVFTTALGFALDVFKNGYTDIFSKKVVELLVSNSAEVDALNRALNSEPDLNLAEISLSCSLFGYSAEEYQANA